MAGPQPANVALAGPVVGSPTFVLIESGKEIGRIVGYPGADFFWGLLAQLIEKLEAAPSEAASPTLRQDDNATPN
jgi:hypothetical protein